ncbi:MAG: PaaI family thioesterase [Gemmatimonadota bacterium]|nr:PaaI family thioesterase [Gemmatimonadota bacterium]
MTDPNLQDTYAPNSICFGCGPANPEGLHVKSVPDGDSVVSSWTPGPNHEAFPGVLNGGIIGTLLDCHCNWAAVHALMLDRGVETPVVTVTASYEIKLRKPTPTDRPVTLFARAVEVDGDRVIVAGELRSGDEVTATCTGLFVAVREGHPAHDAWEAER